MTADADLTGTSSRRGSMLVPVVLAVGIAFVIGLAAMAWLLRESDSVAKYLGVSTATSAAAEPMPSAEPTPEPAVAVPRPAPPAGETQRLVIDPETSRRVSQLEQRVEAIDRESRSAIGNADRAEGLLVAFAARRALDRGVQLGYIEGLLRQRFGNTQPAAVGTVIAAARDPVTLEELQLSLQAVSETLAAGSPNQSWWTALRHELGSLVAVRRSGTPSTLPVERLRRAERRLDAGQVDVALAEVLRMPGRERAAAWIRDARRYVSARRALDTIETAALLEPRSPELAARETRARS
jgi:hypothetical protein